MTEEHHDSESHLIELFALWDTPHGLSLDDFVQANCADEPQIGAEFRRLVEAGERGEKLRLREEQPPPEPTPDSPMPDQLTRTVHGLADDAHAVAPGTRVRYFGDYELLDEIGHGGMGIVYKARQISLNRIVALKMILFDGRCSPEHLEHLVRRFKVEAQAAALLDHTGIVPVYEIGEFKRQNYFTMKYITGPNLEHELTNGALLAKRAAGLINQVAESLSHAHQQGVLHRDVKPSNILVSSGDCGTETALLTDFGLAKLANNEQNRTKDGQPLGTFDYMSPEQATGKQDEIDARSDVYSLGATLYRLLTGRPLYEFEGATLKETIDRICTSRPVSPRQFNKSVPPDLERICLKCLEKHPGDRFQTARELAESLNCFLRNEPLPFLPISPALRTWRWCQRQPLVAALTAAIALSLVSGILVSSYFAVSAIAQRDRADEKTMEATKALVNALMVARADGVPSAIRNLEPLREKVLPILVGNYEDAPLPSAQRLHAAFAMASFGRVETYFLVRSVPSTVPDEFRNLITALRAEPAAAAHALCQQAEKAGTDKDWQQKARLAIVALCLGESALARDMLQVEQRTDPVQRTVFIKTFSTWHGDLADLLPALESSDDSAIRSGICCAIGTISPDVISTEERKKWELALSTWYRSKPDSVTHSAARFALGQWKLALPPIAPTALSATGAQWYVNSVGMTLVLVPSGEFSMGSPDSENNTEANEKPQHRVRITKPFWLGMHPVTVGQFRTFVKDKKYDTDTEWQTAFPSQTDDCPVVGVSWDDAKAFCDWLTRREGKKYALPTEAQWEYACQAGTRTEWNFGNNEGDLIDYAWFDLNSKSQTHPVAQKLPNAWGLSDMLGNVWEHCQDWYDSGYYKEPPPTDDPPGPVSGYVSEHMPGFHVLRGGCWHGSAVDCRSAYRISGPPAVLRAPDLGFRVSLVPADK